MWVFILKKKLSLYYINTDMHAHKGFPSGSMVKNLPTNAGEQGSIPGLGRSLGVGNSNPLQYVLLRKSHGQRSLAGYSPWDHKRVRL